MEEEQLIKFPAAEGQLFLPPDVDSARQFFMEKPRMMVSKLTTAREAVARFINDGDYIAVSGLSTNRIPMSIVHEVARQRRKHLGFAGHSSTHDFQVLVGADCIDRCDCAYAIGLEARGLSPSARRAVESGRIQMTEWSNGGLAWRYKAAAMGIPFMPARVMLGTDTFRYSAAKLIQCPFTGIELAAMPALYPDVALIHVHRADEFGNCQIDGITVADLDLARAAKHVIISTEYLVSNEEMRLRPHLTSIPYYCVDAVVVQRYGSYPCNMPYEYFSDEDHLREWMKAERDPGELSAFMEKHIYGLPDFASYLELMGGEDRIAVLRTEELLENGEANAR